MVDGFRIRFDFIHGKPVSTDEIVKMEALVNEQIAKAVKVESTVMGNKDALASGAMALFGEKYGDEVRVLKIGTFSTELCGGTHVGNTSQLRLFKIVSESGVSSGVRRIEAITGDIACHYAFKNISENQKARSSAGLNESWTGYLETQKELPSWIEDKKYEIKELQKEIKKFQGSQINIEDFISKAKSFASKSGSARLVLADLGLEDRDVLAQITDQLKISCKKGWLLWLAKATQPIPSSLQLAKS